MTHGQVHLLPELLASWCVFFHSQVISDLGLGGKKHKATVAGRHLDAVPRQTGPRRLRQLRQPRTSELSLPRKTPSNTPRVKPVPRGVAEGTLTGYGMRESQNTSTGQARWRKAGWGGSPTLSRLHDPAKVTYPKSPFF